MIFGVARHQYDAPARFKVNGPVDRIRYYYAQPGATYYLEPNVFFPIEQTLQYHVTDGVGELTTAKRANWKPRLPPGAGGSSPDGTEDDFLGLTVYDGPVPIADVPDCRVPKMIRFRCNAWKIPPASLKVGFVGVVPTGRRLVVGLGVVAAYPHTSASGVAFLGVVPGKKAIEGVAFGADVKAAAAFEGKIAFVGQSKLATPGPALPKLGLLCTAKAPGVSGGVAFGGTMANFTFTAGTLPIPGDTCPGAATLSFDTDYTFTVG